MREDSLPAHVEETVQAIGRLHASHRSGATGLQRVVDRLARFLGQPRFVGMLALCVLGWIAGNLAAALTHVRPLDSWPYSALQGMAGLTALFVTVLILISQRRENELTQLREQLALELAIVSEQKAAKIIELLEELRRDLPIVRDRDDEAAAMLSQPSDPEAVIEALKQSQDPGPAPEREDR